MDKKEFEREFLSIVKADFPFRSLRWNFQDDLSLFRIIRGLDVL